MQQYFALLLSLGFFVFPLHLKADGTFWSSFNANILMSQIGVASPSVILEPMQPAAALYSIEGSNNSVFNPEYLQEAVLGIAFNDLGEGITSTNDFSGTGNQSYGSDGAGYGVGSCCYQGGFGGIAGSGANSGGGGDFSYYSASSNYSLGGMGFTGGGGGGGGNNPPTDTPPNDPPPTDNPPPPEEPPPQHPPPPPIVPEPETWLILAGTLSIVLFLKRRLGLRGAHGTEKTDGNPPKN